MALGSCWHCIIQNVHFRLSCKIRGSPYMACGDDEQHPPGWDEHLVLSDRGTAGALGLCHVLCQGLHVLWPVGKALLGGEILQSVFQGLIQRAPDQIKRRRYLHLFLGQKIHFFWDSGRKAKDTVCKWRLFYIFDLCRESHFLHQMWRKNMIPEENLFFFSFFKAEILVNPDFLTDETAVTFRKINQVG